MKTVESMTLNGLALATTFAGLGIIIQTARRKPELAATPEGQEQLKARRAAASILSGAASILSAVGILLERPTASPPGWAASPPPPGTHSTMPYFECCGDFVGENPTQRQWRGRECALLVLFCAYLV